MSPTVLASLVLALFVAALLAGCGSGAQTASDGEASVTVPAGVDNLRGEVATILDQFPYERWYTSCVEKRFGAALTRGEEEALSKASDAKREAKVSEIIGKVEPACEATSDRPLVDPDATSKELDLLRADLVPLAGHLAESEGLDPSQTRCATTAFEKLPDRYIVEFGNGDDKSRGAILLTVFQTCVEAD